ncbi:hypothetical protein Z969_07635 [Clostridium novyi A str. 4570]|uniref:DUF1574 domain-containing protein n=1 Tax=Clostridium novyi A str. 4570 TaxID=1444290 RepID=A0AA89CRF0_CLONO|nr:hypothetical protein [Clostridium novyi]KGN01802.1 hypothetical protein Z969_07635 [Clostridium novyi A str. 4570]
MRRFIKKLIFLLPIPIIIVCVNYFGDAANIFYKQGFYEKGIVKILGTNKNVNNLDNYDERLLQKFYVDNLSSPKDVVILGSSRAMQVSSKILNEKNMFNSSVSGASLEDLMAVYGIYKKDNKLPKKIILELDPWILNKNNGQNRWKSIKEYYFYVSNLVNNNKYKESLIDEKTLELISLSYFQSSLKKVTDKGEKGYTPTELEYCNTNVKKMDGSLSYNEKFRNKTVDEVDKEAIKYASQNPIYCFGNFENIDENYKKQFEGLINLMKKDGVEIEFLLTPYHPIVYDKLVSSSDYKIVVDVEKYFKSFAKKENIKVYGSYNPEIVSCTKEDFYDGMHVKPSGIVKIFNRNTK